MNKNSKQQLRKLQKRMRRAKSIFTYIELYDECDKLNEIINPKLYNRCKNRTVHSNRKYCKKTALLCRKFNRRFGEGK